jgi:hypothetical protein
VKTLSTYWTGGGGALGIVTFLEASLVETHLGQMVEGLPVAWQGGSLQSGELEGGCRAHAAVIKILLAAGGHHMDVSFGCLQRTAAAGVARQLSVRRGTTSEGGTCSTNIVGAAWLAADCGGLLSLAWRLRCGTSSKDGASDNLVC